MQVPVLDSLPEYGILGAVLAGSGAGVWFLLRQMLNRLTDLHDKRDAERQALVDQLWAKIDTLEAKAQNDRDEILRAVKRPAD